MPLIDWKPYGRIIVLIDAANLQSSVVDLGWKVNWRKLARYLWNEANAIRVVYYTASFGHPSHDQLLRSLQRFKFQIVSKPVKVISSRERPDVRKANFDVEIAVDAMDWLGDYDTLMLFSGDSDFAYLIGRLQAKGKPVVVCSTRNHVSKELLASANRYFDIRGLPGGILRKRP